MGNDDGKEEHLVPEWEVVSMTESTYAAAPPPNSSNTEGHDIAETSSTTNLNKDEMTDYRTSKNIAAETSRSMFAFGDFVFPPSQHENLPLEPEVLSEYENEDANEVDDFGSNFVVDEGGIRTELEHQNQMNMKGYHFPVFDARGNLLSVDDTELAEHDALPRPAHLRSSRGELSRSAPAESSVIDEVTESNNQESDSSISSLPKHTNKDDDASNLPCGAWWNRRVASLYAQTKEANGLWSVCVAAAILGLLILGQQWQQERWQLLQLKWQSSLFDEKAARILGPVTRFKDMLIGGHRHGSLISSTDS